MKTRVIVIAAGVAAAFGAYILFSNLTAPNFIPEEFTEARLNGAELASKIVSLADDSLNNISEIARFDDEGDKDEALILIAKELAKNREMRDEAIRLSAELEKMARSLRNIKPSQARILATEAVSSEVALVSRLISYNDYLLQLFETLKEKVQTPSVKTNGRVEELVKKINEEAKAINEFNGKFSQSLAEFDKMF
ncbi:MAG TPA: hypothetical protein VJB92_01445 [Candidatus Paceibacterota bacterium]